MRLSTLIDEIQSGISELQFKLDLIKQMDNTFNIREIDMLMTRQEAASYIFYENTNFQNHG